MTDINRIIEVLQERKVCALCVDGSDENCFKCKLAEGMTSSEIIDSFDAAIQAVQEKAEREKGCEYCTGDVDERPILIKSGGEYVYIDGNGKLTLNDLNGLQLNLCPMCGRKLGE